MSRIRSPRPARRADGITRAARVLAAALCLALVPMLAACPPARPGAEPEAWVEIGTQRVAVDLAETPQEQQLGLGGRDDLPWDHGMYFTYDRPGVYAFWMKGMRFSIDIVWIRNGRVVDVSARVPFVPGENGPTVRPGEAADAVLEVPAGYAAASGWRRGDRVRVERRDGSVSR